MLRKSMDLGHASCIIRHSTGFATSAVFDATTLSADGTGGVNEVQTVTITGTPTGGTVTLTSHGSTTATIAYNAVASVVEDALEALPTIGQGNVRVTGGPGPGTAWVVTFINDLGHANQPAMTASGAGLTGGTTPAIAVAQTTAGSATGFDQRVTVGSFDDPGTIVVKVVDPHGDGMDRIREYAGTGTIYGLVDGIEVFLANTSEADRALPVWGRQAGLVVDARKIHNYSTYKSAIDTFFASKGVEVRHG